MNDIAVFADSWSRGEWVMQANGRYRSDEYFTFTCQKYFTNVFNPNNSSRGNEKSVIELIGFLKNTSKEVIKNTKILFIQTDPARSLSLYYIPAANQYTTEYIKNVFTQSDALPFFAHKPQYQLTSVLKMNIEMVYHVLNAVAQVHDITINMVGGWSDLDPCIKHYNRLNPVCMSWLQLIEPSHTPSIFSTFNPDIDLTCMNKDDYNTMLTRVYSRDMCTKKHSGTYFGKNDYHPSRKGIDLLLEHIHDKLL